MYFSSNALTSPPAGCLLVLLQSSEHRLLTANELDSTIQLAWLQRGPTQVSAAHLFFHSISRLAR